MIKTMCKIIQSLFSSIMKELFLHLVCLHDIDEAVNNNPIVVLFNHEEIAIIETIFFIYFFILFNPKTGENMQYIHIQ